MQIQNCKHCHFNLTLFDRGSVDLNLWVSSGAEGAIEKLVVYKGTRYLAVISNIGHYRCNPPRVTLGLKIGYPKSSLFRLDCLVTPLLSSFFSQSIATIGYQYVRCSLFIIIFSYIFPFKIAIKSFYHQFHSFSKNFGMRIMRSAPRPDWTRRILPPFEGTKPWSKSPPVKLRVKRGYPGIPWLYTPCSTRNHVCI